MTARTWLSTSDVADLLGGVGTAFVIGEIKDGRLACPVAIKRPSGRTYYRIAPEDLRAYCERHCPSLVPRLKDPAA